MKRRLPTAGAQATPKYVPPLAVKDAVIRDARGREVRPWGVNYYAPFSHTYQNLAEVGADYGQAIAEGNGAYRLLRTGDRSWELAVFPNERLVNDPFRGRSFRPMANRCMNANELPVVSRLLDGPRRFSFRLGGGPVSCARSGPGQAPAMAPDGSFTLRPGTYSLTQEGASNPR